MAARKYEVETCPIHGPEKMRGGSIGDQRARCFVVAKRTADRVTYCYETESVTAYDSRDVDPLLKAVREMLVDGGLRYDRPLIDALREALAPFDSEEKT
jgi:hypothetical protein